MSSLKKEERLFFLLWLILFALNALDVYLTGYGIEIGVIVKDNPSMRIFIGEEPIAIFIGKYFLVFIMLFWLCMLRDGVELLLARAIIVLSILVSIFFNIKHLQWIFLHKASFF